MKRYFAVKKDKVRLLKVKGYKLNIKERKKFKTSRSTAIYFSKELKFKTLKVSKKSICDSIREIMSEMTRVYDETTTCLDVAGS